MSFWAQTQYTYIVGKYTISKQDSKAHQRLAVRSVSKARINRFYICQQCTFIYIVYVISVLLMFLKCKKLSNIIIFLHVLPENKLILESHVIKYVFWLACDQSLNVTQTLQTKILHSPFVTSWDYPRGMGFRTIIDFPIWRLTVLTLHSYDDWNFQRMAG